MIEKVGRGRSRVSRNRPKYYTSSSRSVWRRENVQKRERERVTEVKQIHKFVKKHDLASTMNRKC